MFGLQDSLLLDPLRFEASRKDVVVCLTCTNTHVSSCFSRVDSRWKGSCKLCLNLFCIDRLFVITYILCLSVFAFQSSASPESKHLLSSRYLIGLRGLQDYDGKRILFRRMLHFVPIRSSGPASLASFSFVTTTSPPITKSPITPLRIVLRRPRRDYNWGKVVPGKARDAWSSKRERTHPHRRAHRR
jgi:hypothetical protein